MAAWVSLSPGAGPTDGWAEWLVLVSSTERWSVTRGNVSWMSAAHTPVRPCAARTCSGLARNSA